MYLIKLSACEPKFIDDIPCYKLSDICKALQLQQDKAAKLVDKTEKRFIYKFIQGYRSTRYCYLTRAGVESIIIRYAGKTGLSRSELMDALPKRNNGIADHCEAQA